MITDPAEEWEYRGVQCVLYRYPKPDGACRLVGYVEIGDVWIEAVDIDDDVGDIDHVKRQIEGTVDTALNDAVDAIQEEDNSDPLGDLDLDPSPDIDPIEPVPRPWPPEPSPPDPNPHPISPWDTTWTSTETETVTHDW